MRTAAIVHGRFVEEPLADVTAVHGLAIHFKKGNR